MPSTPLPMPNASECRCLPPMPSQQVLPTAAAGLATREDAALQPGSTQFVQSCFQTLTGIEQPSPPALTRGPSINRYACVEISPVLAALQRRRVAAEGGHASHFTVRPTPRTAGAWVSTCSRVALHAVHGSGMQHTYSLGPQCASVLSWSSTLC